MKNFVQEGLDVTLAAPEAVTSGRGLLVGTIFGIALHAAGSGEQVTIRRRGIFTHAKPGSQAWTLGAALYWDNSAKNFTTTSTSNGNIVGAAAAAVGNGSGETTGTVLLFGVSR